jgi:hypothetical protein
MLNKENLLKADGKVIYTLVCLGGWEFQGLGGSSTGRESMTPSEIAGYPVRRFYNFWEGTSVSFYEATPFSALKITNIETGESTVIPKLSGYNAYQGSGMVWDNIHENKLYTVYLTIEPIY